MVSKFWKKLGFPRFILTEWDVLYFDSFKSLYSHIPDDTLGLTGLVPLNLIETMWNWTPKPERMELWFQLREFVKEKYGYSGYPKICSFPCGYFTKDFLEKYSEIETLDIYNDELRLTLFASTLDYKIMDTGFHNNKFTFDENKYFNTEDIEITLETVNEERMKTGGVKVFHPFKKEFI